MAIMKTLTVGTETYTVRDPEAVSFEQPQTLDLSQQQRARENIGAISEKEMVDKLCSGFTESGTVVTCQPVEGYPLEVEWQTKNHFNTTLEYGTWSFSAKRKNENANYVRTADRIPVKPGAIYKFSGTASQFWQGNMAFYDKDGVYMGDSAQIYTFNSFTAPSGAYYMAFHMPVSYSSYVVDPSGTVQMEIGTTATAYEPYAETATITHCGKNLIDPTEYMKKSTATTLDGDVFTTDFEDGAVYVNRLDKAKHHPAGTYTVSVIPVSEIISLSVFVYDKATGDTVASLLNMGTTNACKLTFTATAPFRISIAGPTTNNNAGVFGTYSYKLQLEVGSTATEYEPYNGSAFAAGETIAALPGINTIYADAGLVTVTGKADPAAIIDKLTNAILSLGGNV